MGCIGGGGYPSFPPPATRASSAVSSVVEHLPDTEGVTGSNPVSRTIFDYQRVESLKPHKSGSLRTKVGTKRPDSQVPPTSDSHAVVTAFTVRQIGSALGLLVPYRHARRIFAAAVPFQITSRVRNRTAILRRCAIRVYSDWWCRRINFRQPLPREFHDTINRFNHRLDSATNTSTGR